MDTGKVAAVSHGRVAVIAWPSDSTAVGREQGGSELGEECARRHGDNPEVFVAAVLGRLPAMTNQDDLGVLLPSRWQPQRPVLWWTLKHGLSELMRADS